MGMILRIASSRIVGQGDIVGRSGYFSLNLSANSVMRGRLDARRTLKSLVADLREIQNVNVHHGHNIRRTRIEKNIKQDALAALVNMTQPNVSKYEKMRVIEDEMLNRFARALNVPVEYLKTLEEDAPSVVFENITNNVHDNKDSSVPITGYKGQDATTNSFNPIDKITELYERLLEEKDEKYAALEKRIQGLEQQNNNGK